MQLTSSLFYLQSENRSRQLIELEIESTLHNEKIIKKRFMHKD